MGGLLTGKPEESARVRNMSSLFDSGSCCRYVQRLTRRAELTDPPIDVTANLQTLRVLMVDLVREF